MFTACHSGKLKLAFTSPDVISTSPKNFLTSRIDFTVLLLFKFLKNHHSRQSCKLKTEFTSQIAKSTSLRLSDTTFFAHCLINKVQKFRVIGGGSWGVFVFKTPSLACVHQWCGSECMPKETFDHSTFQQEQEYHKNIILYVVFILGSGLSRVLGQQV